MNILVVGNGFDLAHGLPTRYIDFLNFLDLIDREQYHLGPTVPLLGKSGTFGLYSLDLSQGVFWDSAPSGSVTFIHGSQEYLEELKSCITGNLWYYYFSDLLDSDSSVGKNWIDFESEIKYIIKAFDEKNDDLYSNTKAFSIGESNDKLNFFDSAYHSAFNKNYYDTLLKDFIDNVYNSLNDLIRALEIYLDDCVNKIELSVYSPDIKDISVHGVLCFNYTNTLQRSDIYSRFGIIPEVDFHYLHGLANAERFKVENDMVLGIDEYRDENTKNDHTNFNLFKKFVQRIIKNTGVRYKEWLELRSIIINTSNNDIYNNTYADRNHNIYIFGHSLDVTDRDIIIDLIDHPSVTTAIFYHDKQQQAQQIANLSKILGQDKLLKYVFAAKPRIIFKQQQEMQAIESLSIFDILG